MNIFDRKKTFGLIWLLFIPIAAWGVPSKSNYPHWNFTDRVTYQKLVKIDQFIESNKGQGLVAVFDWDGTLYNEEIPLQQYKIGERRSGQSIWHIWASFHLHDLKYPNLFPMYRTQDGNAAQYIDEKDDYLEGKTNIKVDDYNKFTQIATFEAGMTPCEFANGVNGYLQDYPAVKNVFYPIMDVMQHMIDSGFNVWIATGSNPYYISSVLQRIEQTVNYRPNLKYHFNLGTVPYDIATGHIVGNAAHLSRLGWWFTNVYDSRFVQNSGDNKLYIVDGPGKYVAIKTYVEKMVKKPAIFYAGNSGGDYEAIDYILSQKGDNVLSIAVNPRGTLLDLVKKYPEKIVVVPVKY